MTTTADRLLAINDIKIALKAAIESKGVPVGAAPFVDYPTLVLMITGGGGYVPGESGTWEGDAATWAGDPVTFGEL